MFSRIMVATDGSPYAMKAEDVAINLAKKLGSRVVALHIIDDQLINPFEVLEDEGKEILSKVTSKGQDAQVVVDEILIVGNPRRDMAKIVNKGEAELLIIGTHGRKGLEKLLLGSVAENALKTVEVPVMLIK